MIRKEKSDITKPEVPVYRHKEESHCVKKVLADLGYSGLLC